MKQNIFFHFDDFFSVRRQSQAHGGLFSLQKRKNRRPLTMNKPIYLALAVEKKLGGTALYKKQHKCEIPKIIRRQAKKFSVDLLNYKNAGDRLHLMIKTKSRLNFQQFLKSITALIARKVSGAKKGNPFGKFWAALAYSRVIEKAKELRTLLGAWRKTRVKQSTQNNPKRSSEKPVPGISGGLLVPARKVFRHD